MRYNILIWILVLFLLAGTVNAMPIMWLHGGTSENSPNLYFNLNDDINLKVMCFNEYYESLVNNETNCTLYVYDFNGEDVAINKTMEYNYNYFSYTIPSSDITKKGEYDMIVLCGNGTADYNGLGEFIFEVTSSGEWVGQDYEGSVVIGIFVLLILITVGVFGLSRMELSQNNILNYVLKGALTIGGMYLVTINMTIAVTLADVFGLGILNELFRYLWLINWSIYLLMFIFVFKYILGALSLWNQKKKQKRMGLV